MKRTFFKTAVSILPVIAGGAYHHQQQPSKPTIAVPNDFPSPLPKEIANNISGEFINKDKELNAIQQIDSAATALNTVNDVAGHSVTQKILFGQNATAKQNKMPVGKAASVIGMANIFSTLVDNFQQGMQNGQEGNIDNPLSIAARTSYNALADISSDVAKASEQGKKGNYVDATLHGTAAIAGTLTAGRDVAMNTIATTAGQVVGYSGKSKEKTLSQSAQEIAASLGSVLSKHSVSFEGEAKQRDNIIQPSSPSIGKGKGGAGIA